MNVKNMIGMVVAVVVGVILIGPLVSVVTDAQINNGTPVTLTQDYSTNFAPNYNLWAGEDVTINWSADGFTINGESMELSTTQRIIIASDVFACRTGGSGSTIALNMQYLGSDVGYATTFTFEVTNGGEYTLTGANGTINETGTLDWLVYIVPEEGNISLVQPSLVDSFITSKNSDLIVLGSVYTTGENDTFYAYYNGDLTVNPEFEDVSSVEIAKTLRDGYTDIYNTSVTVKIGEETFTPWFILVPKTITGHEASGPMYDTLGVIPILVTVGLILGVVGVAFSRRE